MITAVSNLSHFSVSILPSFSCQGKKRGDPSLLARCPTAHVSIVPPPTSKRFPRPFFPFGWSKTDSSQLSKRTVLRDLQGLLTVDIAHLAVGMGVRRDEVSFGLVVEGGLRWCCKARKKKVDFGTRNNSSCVCRPRAALLRADGWRPAVIGWSGQERSQTGGVAGGVGIEWPVHGCPTVRAPFQLSIAQPVSRLTHAISGLIFL